MQREAVAGHDTAALELLTRRVCDRVGIAVDQVLARRRLQQQRKREGPVLRCLCCVLDVLRQRKIAIGVIAVVDDQPLRIRKIVVGDVVRHHLLGDRVDDLLAVLVVLVQSGKACVPVAVDVRANATIGNQLIVSVQLQQDRARQYIALRRQIQPVLLHLYRDLLRDMVVRYRKAISVADDRFGITMIRPIRVVVDLLFHDAVLDIFALRRVQRQTDECVAPIVARIQRQRFSAVNAVFQQPDRHALGPDPVAVVVVVPLLRDR